LAESRWKRSLKPVVAEPQRHQCREIPELRRDEASELIVVEGQALELRHRGQRDGDVAGEPIGVQLEHFQIRELRQL
jgi:hypothetical protein